MVTVRFSSATDTGHVRSTNQDTILVRPPLFLIADGMGGHAAGELASSLAIGRFAELAGTDPLTVDPVLAAVGAANETILEAGLADPANAGMGTTLTGLVLVGSSWLVLNIGDSRTYRYADGRLEQLTVDHSEVQELIEAGLMPAGDRHRYPRSHVLTRALGTLPPPAADHWVREPETGERFVLCSDGLTDELTDEQIAGVLAAHDDPDAAARALVATALAAGGRDNVSVVVVDVVQAAEAPPQPVG